MSRLSCEFWKDRCPNPAIVWPHFNLCIENQHNEYLKLVQLNDMIEKENQLDEDYKDLMTRNIPLKHKYVELEKINDKRKKIQKEIQKNLTYYKRLC